MSETNSLRRGRSTHVHRAVVTHTVRQHAGIPYEVEQRICAGCRNILDERQLRRAAA